MSSRGGQHKQRIKSRAPNGGPAHRTYPPGPAPTGDPAFWGGGATELLYGRRGILGEDGSETNTKQRIGGDGVNKLEFNKLAANTNQSGVGISI